MDPAKWAHWSTPFDARHSYFVRIERLGFAMTSLDDVEQHEQKIVNALCYFSNRFRTFPEWAESNSYRTRSPVVAILLRLSWNERMRQYRDADRRALSVE